MEEKIKVWDTNTGASLMTFEGDGAPVYTAACLTNAPILMFGTPKHLYSIWLDAEKIVSLALAYRRMGALSPQEIKLFKLESQLQSLGWLDGAGNPTPLIASGDEEQMFNLALYYLEQSKDAFANRQTSLRRHAYQLLVAGRQIAVFHHHKTYDELLGSLYP